jgi:hypothetical protein
MINDAYRRIWVRSGDCRRSTTGCYGARRIIVTGGRARGLIQVIDRPVAQCLYLVHRGETTLPNDVTS